MAIGAMEVSRRLPIGLGAYDLCRADGSGGAADIANAHLRALGFGEDGPDQAADNVRAAVGRLAGC